MNIASGLMEARDWPVTSLTLATDHKSLKAEPSPTAHRKYGQQAGGEQMWCQFNLNSREACPENIVTQSILSQHFIYLFIYIYIFCIYCRLSSLATSTHVQFRSYICFPLFKHQMSIFFSV